MNELKLFSEQELHSLYVDKVKKPPSYFIKHKSFPKCPVKGYAYSWKGKDLPRVFTIMDFIEWIKKYNLQHVDSLGYTYSEDPELEFVTCNKKTMLKYPPDDLHIYNEKYSNTFDFFIFNQTIEHLYNPFITINNLYKYIKKGGYVFTSVPTINIPHSTPIHFNGYSPMGLAILFKSSNFKIIEIGQWGNSTYLTNLFNTHNWPDFTQCPCINEEKNVSQCWILVQKI